MPIPKRKKWTRSQAAIVRKLCLIAESSLSAGLAHEQRPGAKVGIHADLAFAKFIKAECEDALRRIDNAATWKARAA